MGVPGFASPAPVSTDSANTPVLRDGSGNFSANNISLDGNLALPNSTATAGNITKGGVLFMNNLGTLDTFLGPHAGGATTSGSNNAGVGSQALAALTTGGNNTAVGSGTLQSLTNTSYNVAVGYNALNSNTSSSSVAVGAFALESNTTQGGNVAVGTRAMILNTTGAESVAVGFQALQSNVTSTGNTALGYFTLANTTAGPNTAVGDQALTASTTGTGNVAVGDLALQQNTTGGSNVAIGEASELGNSVGNANTSVGANALQADTSSFNTAVGNSALTALTGASSAGNIAIGYTAGLHLTSGQHEILIGSDLAANGAESATIRIGTASNQSAAFIAGVTGTVVTGANVLVSSTGQLGVAASSRDYKEDIHDIAGESDVLMGLRPVSFKYKKKYDARQSRQYGLVAEEVEGVSRDLVEYDLKGKPQTVRYQLVNAMLLNEVQKQHKHIEALERRLEQLERHPEKAPRIGR
jgi:hypothetical protein